MTAQEQQDQNHGTRPSRRMTPLIGGVIGIVLGAVLGVGGTLAVHGSGSTGTGTGAPSGQFPGGGQMPNGGNGSAVPPSGAAG